MIFEYLVVGTECLLSNFISGFFFFKNYKQSRVADILGVYRRYGTYVFKTILAYPVHFGSDSDSIRPFKGILKVVWLDMYKLGGSPLLTLH